MSHEWLIFPLVQSHSRAIFLSWLFSTAQVIQLKSSNCVARAVSTRCHSLAEGQQHSPCRGLVAAHCCGHAPPICNPLLALLKSPCPLQKESYYLGRHTPGTPQDLFILAQPRLVWLPGTVSNRGVNFCIGVD